eukprot:gene3981-4982_t
MDRILMEIIFSFKVLITCLLVDGKSYIPLSIFIVLCIIVYLTHPQPSPKNTNQIQFFNQLSLQDTISNSSSSSSKGGDEYWLIELFTTWSPPCSYLASTFADLSIIYKDYINFGKCDIGRWKTVAFKYNIDDSYNSKQIPTLILFKNGIELERLPFRKDEYRKPYDSKRETTKENNNQFMTTNFTEDEIIEYFQLDQIKLELDQKKQSQLKNKKKN